MATDEAVRSQVAKLLDWHDAHVSFDEAVRALPAELLGRVPEGLPYSPWQLVEHIRLAQRDILDFCLDPGYREPSWPDDYWPSSPAPPSSEAWEESLAAVRRDCAALQALAMDAGRDLTDPVPQGSGQSYLRELLLAVDHTAYHTGELVVTRRLLGAWPPAEGSAS